MSIVLCFIGAFSSIGLAFFYLVVTPPPERIASEGVIVIVGCFLSIFFMSWAMWREAVMQPTKETATCFRRNAILFGLLATTILLNIGYKILMF